jgi:hypothetical protein
LPPCPAAGGVVYHDGDAVECDLFLRRRTSAGLRICASRITFRGYGVSATLDTSDPAFDCKAFNWLVFAGPLRQVGDVIHVASSLARRYSRFWLEPALFFLPGGESQSNKSRVSFSQAVYGSCFKNVKVSGLPSPRCFHL